MATPEHSRTKLLLIQAVRTACMSCSNSHKDLSSPWRSSEDSTVVRFVWSMDMTQGRIEHVRRIIVRSTCTSVYQCTPSMSVEKLPTVYRTCVGCQTMHPPLLSVHRKKPHAIADYTHKHTCIILVSIPNEWGGRQLHHQVPFCTFQIKLRMHGHHVPYIVWPDINRQWYMHVDVESCGTPSCDHCAQEHPCRYVYTTVNDGLRQWPPAV